MELFDRTYHYFRTLSTIPRPSRHEGPVREWITGWARSHDWPSRQDTIGNLLVTAPGKKSSLVCLQAHMDMVCVCEKEGCDFLRQGIEILDDGNVIRANGTTLGADNGIGIATMMALAESDDRPTLELLFTMGEEIGLIGAYHIELPLRAPLALNLDWCDSDTIGIGCGGTLLMEAELRMPEAACAGKALEISLAGMPGGHSGMQIQEHRGNAIIELCRIIADAPDIRCIADMHGGDADNALPRSARATICLDGPAGAWEVWLKERTLKLRQHFNNDDISLTVQEAQTSQAQWYEKDICVALARLDSGVQVFHPDTREALSSWNLGRIALADGAMRWCYFLRTNIVSGIEPMKQKILSGLNKYSRNNQITFAYSHE